MVRKSKIKDKNILTTVKADLKFGEEGEKELEKILNSYYEKKIIKRFDKNKKFNILDYRVEKLDGSIINIELKTRNNTKGHYETTVIGLNKLIEALSKYNELGEETIFLFKFLSDGFRRLNPLDTPYKELFYGLIRYDRLGKDKVKGWVYYNINDLLPLNNLTF